MSAAAGGGAYTSVKAVGEPPLMLALSVVAALREAVSAFGRKGIPVELHMPCTPEALLKSIDVMRAR